eukprot:jgi/Chrzof1/11506/UNPLg00439.t1
MDRCHHVAAWQGGSWVSWKSKWGARQDGQAGVKAGFARTRPCRLKVQGLRATARLTMDETVRTLQREPQCKEVRSDKSAVCCPRGQQVCTGLTGKCRYPRSQWSR